MAGLTLHMTRVLPAPPARVFRALTEPGDLARWWGPNGFTTPGIAIDLRVGGAYRFAMQPPEGALFHLTGEFREVEPPARLSYSFRWEEPDPEDVETLVTLSLRDLGDATELTFTQGAFATERRRALHEGGWSEGLVRLERVLADET
jgi:uncharacterized protein YndB with AHSA1/START domain